MPSPQVALLYAMGVAAGSGRELAPEDIGIIGDLVEHLPIFCGIDRRQVAELATRCSEQLAGPGEQLRAPHRQLAHLLAVDVAEDRQVVDQIADDADVLLRDLAIGPGSDHHRIDQGGLGAQHPVSFEVGQSRALTWIFARSA